METTLDPRTLSIDIGGSGLKMMVLNDVGEPITDRLRRKTPDTPTPTAVIDELLAMTQECGEFERISCGFPGVVVAGVVKTAVNLTDDWINFDLASALSAHLEKPVRVANDADIQGLGAVEGRGVELVLTLGTGIGSALFVDGRLVPNLEFGHHPFEKGKTYEERLGEAELKRKGDEKWNERLQRAISILNAIFNYRMLYLGGGNAKKISFELPANVQIVPNITGILGGIRLWDQG